MGNSFDPHPALEEIKARKKRQRQQPTAFPHLRTLYTADELRVAVEAERERCATIAMMQRCERGTSWDLACTTIAREIRKSEPSLNGACPKHD